MLPLLIYVLIAPPRIFAPISLAHALARTLLFVLFLSRTHARTRLKEHFFPSSSSLSSTLRRLLLRHCFAGLPSSHSFAQHSSRSRSRYKNCSGGGALWLCWSPQFLLLRRRRHVVHFTEQIFALLVY